jgi:hypothetical protein
MATALPAVPRDLRRMAAKVGPRQKSLPGQPYEDRGAVRIPRSPGRSENRAHVQGRTSGARRRGGVLDPLIRNCGMLAEADGEFRLQSPGVAFSMT